MAVATNSKAAPYPTDKRKNVSEASGTNHSTFSLQNNSYADSPSRQLRRSSRVASLSPSSFTPLINDQTSSSGSSSASSSASSYMPASPSRKYSMMRGYNGVSIDEITINEIEPENRAVKKSLNSSQNSYSASSYAPQQLQSSLYPSLSLNSERKHLTLEFQPTNLSTPSITLLPTGGGQSSSGITPSVNKISIQETPGQSNRILERLVSRGDFEEIAKATPLGNKSTISSVATGEEREIPYKERPLNPNYINNRSYSANPAGSNNSNLPSKVQVIQSNMVKAANTTKTPQKPTGQVENSDETVKVVRTLRNRSILASPLPASRSSINTVKAPQPLNFYKIDLPVYFKKHQKNLLAYSLAALFILATAYHIYDGLGSVDQIDKDVPTATSISKEDLSNVTLPPQPTAHIDKEEVVKLISQVSENRLENIQEALSATFAQKLNLVEARLDKRFEAFHASREAEIIPAGEVKKALEGVASTVKKLEKKFKDLEAKMDAVQKDIRKAENSGNKREEIVRPFVSPSSISTVSVPLKLVKHLCSRPLSCGFMKSTNFPPENALSDTPEPFKFPGNRGKFAVLLPPHFPHFPTEISLELPSSRLAPADRTCLPKDFEIWGLPDALNERENPVLLFRGTFDAFSESQKFKLKHVASVKVLQLRIRNNHGNHKFTCLYRFQALTSVTL